MKKILAILIAAAGTLPAMADVATTLKYDDVPAHVTLTIAGSFQGDFSVSVTGVAASATLEQYSYGEKGWTITATADTGYAVPTFSTCSYDDTGDDAATAQAHAGTATRTGINVHVYDIQVSPVQSQVNFALSGGSLPAGAPSSIIVTYDSTYGTLPLPTRTGYTFSGWYTAAEGGTRVTADTKVAITSPQTLYAHWTPITYTVTFSANGGSGTMSPMTLTYDQGTNLTANAFTRANYTFSKWRSAEDDTYSDGARVINLASTAGAVVALDAQWTAISYTITFDSDGGSAVAPIVKPFGSAVVPPVKPTRTGYTFERWSPALPETMPPRDMKVTAIWKVNPYRIYFDANGGSSVETIEQLYGTTVVAPANPVHDGYVFAGWSPVLPATMPANDLRVTAQWTIRTCTITFDSAGGSSVSPISQEYRTLVTAPAAPTRKGYTFAGWSPAVPATMPASDMTVTAQWTVNSYVITFDTAGGSAVAPIAWEYGASVTPPADPTREGYTFSRWSPALPTTMPANDLTVTAQWAVNSYVITFDTAGGSPVSPITQEYGTAVTPPAEPVREGYTFAGWSPAVPATMPASDMTVTAQWTINSSTITFDSDGGSAVSPITQNYGTSVRAPASPTREGYTFSQWSPAVPTTMPAADLTVKAQWAVNSYVITFDAAGGPPVDSITQEYGTAVMPPDDPTREGYTFVQWSPELPATMPANNLTVKAQWMTNAYTVVFDAAGGLGTMAPMTLSYGQRTNLTANVFTRDYYTFAGWKAEDGAEYADGAPVTNLSATAGAVVTLAAQWTMDKYVVTFDANGGSGEMDPMTLTYGVATNLSANVFTRAYSEFSGWKTEDGTEYADGATVSNLTTTAGATVKFLAQWAVTNEFTITFNSTGGTEVASITQKYGAAVTPPADPTREGYTFVRWSPALPATMPPTDLEVTAIWRVNECTITFDSAGGSEVAPITQLVGTTVKPPAAPVREGYTFVQWSPAVPATMPTNDLTVTAQWIVFTNDTYSLVFDANGGDGGETMTNWTVAVESPVTLPPNAFTKTGCAFAGWRTNTVGDVFANCEKDVDLAGTPGDTVTLYAQWEPYEVIFSIPDGVPYGRFVDENVPVGSLVLTNYYTEGRVFGELPAVTNSAPNEFSFACWRYKQEGVWQTVATNTIVPPRAVGATNLVVRWNHSTTRDEALDVTNLTVGTEYVYNGAIANVNWEVVPDDLAEGGKSVMYQGDRSCYPLVTAATNSACLLTTLKGPGTLTFCWRVESAAVASAGSGSPWQRTLEKLTCYTNNQFVCGYAADSNQYLSVEREDGKRNGVVPIPPEPMGSAMLRWETNTVDLTWLGTEEEMAVVWKFQYMAESEEGNPPWPARVWIDNIQWTGAANASTAPVSTAYTLTFDRNDGEGNMEDLSVDDADGTNLTANAFTRDGYTFVGWNTQSNGTGLAVADGAHLALATDVTLYAQWSTNATYTITFNAAGGSDVAPITDKYGTAVTPPANPTREGYTFDQWSPAVPATMPASNLTLTAQWTANSYTITFELGGGSGLDSITQECDTPVVLPVTAPTREGYTFVQWSSPVPATMPASNLTLTAVWTRETHSIVFDSAGGSEVQPITKEYGEAVTVTSPVREGYTFAGWSSSLGTMPSSNLTVTALWTVNTYTNTFDSADGSEVQLITQEYGTDITPPADPTREGYTFVQWSPAVSATMPAANLTLTAQWTTNSRTITFDSAGGSPVSPITQEYGTAITPPTNPTHDGCTFVQWSPAVPATMPANDLTVTAQWTTNTYTITFDAAGGSPVASITQAYGTAMTAPAAPVRAGYAFAGWSPALPGTMPATDLVVTAQWTANSYAITFDAAGGSPVASITQAYGTAVTPPDNPVRDGYSFVQWSPALPGTMPAANLTVTAQWATNVYVVAFDPAGGVGAMSTMVLAYGQVTNLTANAFTRERCMFVGWETEDGATYGDGAAVSNLTAAADATVTLFAQWSTNAYTVTLDRADGSEPDTLVFETDAKVTVSAPVREGYTFVQWSPALPATMPASNLTVTAQWSANAYAIAFDAAGGSSVDPIEQEYGTAVTAPDEPVRENYAFAGWSPALPETMPASNLTVTAQWTLKRYTVSFDLGEDASGLEPITQEYGRALVLPTTAPVREGYTFAGWSPELPSVTTNDMTLVALWTPELHSIVFDVAGGSEVPAMTLAYGAEVTVADPVRAGYAFAGWSPALPATMPAADLTATATWTPTQVDPPNPPNPPTPDNPDKPENPENPETPDTPPAPVEPEQTNTVRRLYESVASEFVAGAATYDGYLYDAAGRVAGLVQVKRSKYNEKKDLAKVTASVTLAGQKKVSYKGGEWHLDSQEVVLTSTRDSRVLRVVMGTRGLSGTYGAAYAIDGAVNASAAKDADVKADGAAVLDAVRSAGGTFALAIPSDNGWGGLSIEVKTSGKVAVKGTLADGTRVNISTSLLIGEKACCIPVVSTKFATPAFAVWLSKKGVPEGVVGLDGAKLSAVKSNLAAGATFLVDDAALVKALGDSLLTDYLPNGFSVTMSGSKWLVANGAKAGKVSIDKKTGARTTTSENWASLKLSYKEKTGQFSGSFKAYTLVGGKLKSTTVKVAGVLVDGIGYGAATVKKATAAVMVTPKNN